MQNTENQNMVSLKLLQHKTKNVLESNDSEMKHVYTVQIWQEGRRELNFLKPRGRGSPSLVSLYILNGYSVVGDQRMSTLWWTKEDYSLAQSTRRSMGTSQDLYSSGKP